MLSDSTSQQAELSEPLLFMRRDCEPLQMKYGVYSLFRIFSRRPQSNTSCSYREFSSPLMKSLVAKNNYLPPVVDEGLDDKSSSNSVKVVSARYAPSQSPARGGRIPDIDGDRGPPLTPVELQKQLRALQHNSSAFASLGVLLVR